MVPVIHIERATSRRPAVTSLAAVTLGLGLLALVDAVRARGVPATRVGCAAGARGVHRGPARPAAIDGRRAAPGDDRRDPQHGDRALPDQCAVRGGGGAATRRGRLVRRGRGSLRDRHRPRADRLERSLAALAALGNAAVVLLLVFARGWVLTWVVAIAGALRIFGIAWNIMAAPVYDHGRRRRDRRQRARAGGSARGRRHGRGNRSGRARAGPIDRGWTLAFIATLFAIHIGRMSTDLTFLGLVSPAVAVLGDMLDRGGDHAARDQPAAPAVARAHSMDRAAHVALASRGAAVVERGLDRTPGGHAGSAGG